MNLTQLKENRVNTVNRVLKDLFGTNINFNAETDKLQNMYESTQSKISKLRSSGVDVTDKNFQKLLLIAEGFESVLEERGLEESADLDTAEVLLAAKQMADDLQKMAENLASMQVEDLMSITNAMKEEVGPAEAEAFSQAAEAAISGALEAVKAANEGVNNAVLAAQGQPTPTDMDAPMDAPMDEPAGDDMDVDVDMGDDFGGADAADEMSDADGREMKEAVSKDALKEKFAKIKQ